MLTQSAIDQSRASAKAPWPPKFPRRGGRGKRKPIGEMNGTERKFALHLDALQRAGKIEWYTFETATFRLADRTTYTPDFWVMLPDQMFWYVEVKGTKKSKLTGKKSAFCEPHNILKIKIAAEQLPCLFSMVWIDAGAPDGWGRKDFWEDEPTQSSPGDGLFAEAR